jgi:hypothetical protein
LRAETAATQPAAPGKSASALAATRSIWIAMAAVAAAVFAFGAVLYLLDGTRPSLKTNPAVASFVGSETCAGCHQAEAKLWNASQHKAAMQHATDYTVLGNFNAASFDYFGVRSRFFRKDDKFLVETDGADGRLATFEVKYTFGVDPLQHCDVAPGCDSSSCTWPNADEIEAVRRCRQ